MKRLKKAGILFGSVVVVLIIAFGIMFIGLSQNMNEIKAIPIEEIDFTRYDDGLYEGLYYYEDQIGATVQLNIIDGEVVTITFLDHKYGLGGKAESITIEIIENQSIMVDDISGATTSSHIIKLAIQNAMEEEQ